MQNVVALPWYLVTLNSTIPAGLIFPMAALSSLANRQVGSFLRLAM
jgi:hypothetical protein